MMLQITLEGELLQAEGLSRAASHKRAWFEKAREKALELLEYGSITSEDITDEIGLPDGKTGINRNNAIGAVFQGLSSQGFIEPVGYVSAKNPQAHARRITLWGKKA